MLKWLLAVPAALVIAVIGWLDYEGSVETTPPKDVTIEIPRGVSSARIATILADAGVIRSALAFRIHARLKGTAGEMQSGEYRFYKPDNLNDIMERMRKGYVVRYDITIPEGLRTDEILNLLAEQSRQPLAVWQEALAKTVPGQETEGMLLPETYSYTKPLRPETLLQEMRDAQQKVLDSLSSDPDVQARLRIIASIIEKETSLDDERPLISAVIRNRLQKHMRLQMDPTVIYGIYRTRGSFSGDIRTRDLRADTPWSTYTRRGLPPTPICNPGAASLRAAANPADVDYLFFVANGSGGHAFATTNAEHQANVARWLKIERRRNREANSGR